MAELLDRVLGAATHGAMEIWLRKNNYSQLKLFLRGLAIIKALAGLKRVEAG